MQKQSVAAYQRRYRAWAIFNLCQDMLHNLFDTVHSFLQYTAMQQFITPSSGLCNVSLSSATCDLSGILFIPNNGCN